MEKKRYFISYTTRTEADIQWATWIEWIMREYLGHKTIMQKYDSVPGGNFKIFMDNALKDSDCVIGILSREYMQSTNCAEEWTNAKELRFVKIDDCNTEGLLKNRAYLDLHELCEDDAKEKIVAYLELPERPNKNPGYPFMNKVPSKISDTPAFPGTSKPKTKDATNPMNNLPDRNPYFSGRKILLKDIHCQFQNSKTVSLRQAVAGLGGVGKSQVAIEYAYRYANDYDTIWWVSAENSSAFQEAYKAFAQRKNLLHIDDTNDWLLVLETVKAWFDEHERFLFILDNVEDFNVLSGCLPRLSGHVLITTRNKNAPLGMHVDIAVFSPEEATSFLRERLNRDECDAAVKLAERLGFLPLALEQAAAYILVTSESCQSYLKLLDEYGLRVFTQRGAEATAYAETVATTWSISFKRIKLDCARQLLNLCSYFEPDDIPLSIFIEGRDKLPKALQTALADKLCLNDTIFELTSFSLLKDKDGLISLHRLVQEVVKNSLAGENQWILFCLDMLCSVFQRDYRNDPSILMFIQHIPHNQRIIQAAGEMLEKNEETLEKLAWLYHATGCGFGYSGNYEEALLWLNEALKIREKLLGQEHQDTAASYNDLGWVYKRLGKPTLALEWDRKALAIRKKVLGDKHPDTALSYDHIATIYRSQGDYREALKLHQKALDIYELTLGKNHTKTATTYDYLGKTYKAMGENELALEFHEKTLEIYEKEFGKKHPWTATTYENIAGVYKDMGQYEHSFELYFRALTIREEVLGENHPETVMTYESIEELYC